MGGPVAGVPFDVTSRTRDLERRVAELEAHVRILLGDRHPRDPPPEIRYSPNGPCRIISTNDADGRFV